MKLLNPQAIPYQVILPLYLEWLSLRIPKHKLTRDQKPQLIREVRDRIEAQ